MPPQSPHDQPAINRNPAQEEIDPDQLTADGRPGENYPLYENTAEAQTDGTRNERVMNVSTDKHNTEPIAEDRTTAYNTPNTPNNATGITNQPLAKEKSSQTEVGSEERHTPQRDEQRSS